MAVRYVARYHSEDDPGGLIREVIELGDEFPGPAGDVLFSWLLRLEADKDPAEVAGRLLRDYGVAEGPLPDGACGELIGLLREVAQYGWERLERTVRRGGRRRGGPGGRRRGRS
jgi:hypothetical protein